MPDLNVTGSIKPRATPADLTSPGIPKPSPISDTVIFVAPPDREARLESRRPVADVRTTDVAASQGVNTTISRLQTALDSIETRQVAALSSAEDSYEARVRRMRGVFTDLGLNMTQMDAAAPKAGIGGPFVPVKPPGGDAGPFERQLIASL